VYQIQGGAVALNGSEKEAIQSAVITSESI
jgi:hypothetical protein